MRRKHSVIGISTAVVLGFYVLSFFLVLAGARARKFEWVENLGLGYALTSTTDERGFVFESDPWMKIYRPLYSETVLYKRSRNPADTVTLNGYGIAMFAVYYWGMWPDEDWAKASSTAKKFAMSSYGEWFPERYE